jgi:exonuclease III
MKIGVWNVRGLYGKEKLLLDELKKADINIAVIPETKKKLKGSQDLEDYILSYSGVPTNKTAAAGIAIMIKAKLKKRIHSYTFVNERILLLRYKLQRGYLTVLAVYAPEERQIEQTEEFYETLQDQTDEINKNDYIIVAGDYNARVVKIPIDETLGTNCETKIYNNGHKLKEFASVNELKITNTFFRHKEIHNMTWSARSHRAIIDYILTNKKLSPLVNDTKVFRGYDVSTD